MGRPSAGRHQTVGKTARRIRFSVLLASARSMAIPAAILRRPGSGCPSAKRGISFLFHALDVNWSGRMSKVQTADNPHCARPRKAWSGCSCSSLAGPPATNMNRDFSLPSIGTTHGQFESGLATGRGATVSFPARFCRARRAGKRIAPAPPPWAKVAVLRRSADIFIGSCKAFAVDRGYPPADGAADGADAPRFFAFADSRAAKARLRGLHGRERGLKLCR